MIFGVGVDTIEIARVKKAVLKSPCFLHRVFTAGEIAICQEKPCYFSSLAARFAAKEAVSKSLGISLWIEKWQQIEITEEEHVPTVVLKEDILQQANQRGVQRIFLSLSHDQDKAIAFAIAEK